MRKMKDSGIEWIGEIPENWSVGKTLYGLSMPITDGPHETPELYEEGIPFVSAEAVSNGNGKIDFEHIRGYISKEYYDECCKKYTPAINDIYMIKSGATTGKIALVDTKEIFTIWSPLAVFRCNKNKCYYKYLYYVLQSDCYQKQIENGWSFGTQQNIGMRTLEKLLICYPEIQEQARIAGYLDKKCAEIDAIIAAKEKTNELLKECRQSIIYEAVTKGLDPTVPMKDSGVEWIGEIPESWDTCKLKYAVECRTEKTVDKSASVAYIGLEHVKSDFGVLVDEYEHIWDFEGDTIDFKLGDVLFGKLRPYLAKAWPASFNGKCSSEFWVMTPIKLTSKFLLYTVLSNHFIANIDHSTFGVKMPRAEWEYAGNQLICCPSIAEQENITEYLDLKCSEIDSLISENAESIEMLKEYRQSVIYEAVTGKIEV